VSGGVGGPDHLRIRDRSGLEDALGADLFLLFKHSFRCPVSGRAFEEYREFVEAHPEVPTGWIDVVADRPLSLRVAEVTGVTHESPQALLIRDGAVAWHASHGAITTETLEGARGV
jgi:bacillithiol system protein YtxJ